MVAKKVVLKVAPSGRYSVEQLGSKLVDGKASSKVEVSVGKKVLRLVEWMDGMKVALVVVKLVA